MARFGEPEPGKKVFIRVQQQRDGWKDMGKDLSEVVLATPEAADRELTGGVAAALTGLK